MDSVKVTVEDFSFVDVFNFLDKELEQENLSISQEPEKINLDKLALEDV